MGQVAEIAKIGGEFGIEMPLRLNMAAHFTHVAQEGEALGASFYKADDNAPAVRSRAGHNRWCGIPYQSSCVVENGYLGRIIALKKTSVMLKSAVSLGFPRCWPIRLFFRTRSEVVTCFLC